MTETEEAEEVEVVEKVWINSFRIKLLVFEEQISLN